ncbi:hypothetical protein N7G274_005208 [Stereocaulon virgatum]|uniref:EKC/KEOPS complex subunit BUD32 n=1 Tax=Stereocaulon virgatum TaxID=373712 RepID=A0ABR4A888_9LECA
MAKLSQNDLNIIAEHPLDTSLDQVREPLRKIEQSYKPGSLSFDGVADGPDFGHQKVLSRLLYTLQGHDVALDLRSKIGNSNIASELSELFKRIQGNRYNYEHYRALSRLVVKKASDVDIWNAVFDLITTVFRTTPPTSIPPSFDGTPVTISSSSQQGAEQIRELVEARIFEEIRGCTYQDVDGFFSKHFEGKPWTERTKKIYQAVQERHVDGRWTDFPQTPVQNEVYKWWFGFQDEFLSSERGVYYTSITKDLTGCEAKRQIDLFVKPNNEELSKVVHDWKDVEVIGELTETDKTKNITKAKLLQIARYVRDVFSIQPTRRYVHAFILRGNEMQAWVFDRSGPYSSTAFNIHDEPERFIRMIAAYVMMSDEELGLDTFIERKDGDQFITVVEDATGKKRRLQLDSAPIAYQRAIVCRGTSCFRAKTPSSKNFQYVAKFSWVSDKRQPEADLLRLARERGVEGVARLFGHHQITSIADMREGLTFGKAYAFRNTTLSPTSSFSQPQSLLSQSFGPLDDLSIARGSPKKRKSMDTGGSQSKRSRSNSQNPDKAKRKNETNSQTTSLYAHDDTSFDNRIFRCLVISPAGRALRDFRSIPELLKALRDAIKAHRSLYTKGKILHRDISENNIIITDREEADGFTGMLIDEDLAKEIGSGRSGARHQTGTMEFMAIEVLQGIDHTYRHDLESFFYVLLWMCARRTWEREFKCKPEDRPKRNILTKWYIGSFDDIADAKKGYMHEDDFEKILMEFPRAFDDVKPLCKTIRGILFPYKNGLLVGTPPDPPEELYNPIIEAFDSAIADNFPR